MPTASGALGNPAPGTSSAASEDDGIEDLQARDPIVGPVAPKPSERETARPRIPHSVPLSLYSVPGRLVDHPLHITSATPPDVAHRPTLSFPALYRNGILTSKVPLLGVKPLPILALPPQSLDCPTLQRQTRYLHFIIRFDPICLSVVFPPSQVGLGISVPRSLSRACKGPACPPGEPSKPASATPSAVYLEPNRRDFATGCSKSTASPAPLFAPSADSIILTVGTRSRVQTASSSPHVSGAHVVRSCPTNVSSKNPLVASPECPLILTLHITVQNGTWGRLGPFELHGRRGLVF